MARSTSNKVQVSIRYFRALVLLNGHSDLAIGQTLVTKGTEEPGKAKIMMLVSNLLVRLQCAASSARIFRELAMKPTGFRSPMVAGVPNRAFICLMSVKAPQSLDRQC